LLDVVEALAGRANGLSLTELARITAIPKTTVSRYIVTLVDRGYVVRGSRADNYRLASSLQPLRPQEVARLVAAVRPWLHRLRVRFQHTANLGVLESNGVTYLEVSRAKPGARYAAWTGSRGAIHSTALGKAIAAQLKEQEVRRILRTAGMPARTAMTIRSVDVYLRELQDVRRRGFARDVAENDEASTCLAVALYGAPLPAAISLTAPIGGLDAETADVAVAALRTAADAITDALESSRASSPQKALLVRRPTRPRSAAGTAPGTPDASGHGGQRASGSNRSATATDGGSAKKARRRSSASTTVVDD